MASVRWCLNVSSCFSSCPSRLLGMTHFPIPGIESTDFPVLPVSLPLHLKWLFFWLNFLGWPWLKTSYRFQMYSSKCNICASHCTITTQSKTSFSHHVFRPRVNGMTFLLPESVKNKTADPKWSHLCHQSKA